MALGYRLVRTERCKGRGDRSSESNVSRRRACRPSSACYRRTVAPRPPPLVVGLRRTAAWPFHIERTPRSACSSVIHDGHHQADRADARQSFEKTVDATHERIDLALVDAGIDEVLAEDAVGLLPAKHVRQTDAG